jgi:Protein of unknown function (DUF1553)
MASQGGGALREGTLLTDPDNRMLWRQNRKRMDAGQLRDTMLVIAGQLDRRWLGPTIGGEVSFSNACDPKTLNVEYEYKFTDTRRSVYAPAFRNKRLELFEVFDFGNNNLPIAKRGTSTVSPQALFMMNHEFAADQSRAAAKTLLSAEAKDDPTRLDSLYRRVLGRQPTQQEAKLALEFVAVSTGEEKPDQAREEQWAMLVQAVFASVDFRYVD